MSTNADTRTRNEALLESLMNYPAEKRGASAIDAWTRVKIYESSFHRQIFQPVQIADSDLDRTVQSDKPVKIIDKMPDCPPAVTVPFGAMSQGYYMYAPKFLVHFVTLQSRRFRKHINELRTYRNDLRTAFSDMARKQIDFLEDRGMIAAINRALGGSAGASSRLGNQQLWKTIPDGVRRESLQDALDIMNQAAGRLEPQICLCTNSFIRQIMKLGRDQIGGNMAEDTLVKGWSSSEFMKCKWVSTVKYELIPRNRLHMLADNEYIGKSFVLDDVSLYVKREEQWLEFYMFETIGLTISNGYGLAIADFDGV